MLESKKACLFNNKYVFSIIFWVKCNNLFRCSMFIHSFLQNTLETHYFLKLRYRIFGRSLYKSKLSTGQFIKNGNLQRGGELL